MLLGLLASNTQATCNKKSDNCFLFRFTWDIVQLFDFLASGYEVGLRINSWIRVLSRGLLPWVDIHGCIWKLVTQLQINILKSTKANSPCSQCSGVTVRADSDCAFFCVSGAQHCRNTACVTGSTTGRRVPASPRRPVVLNGRGGTTGRSHDTWQLWHVTCYMTQNETFLCHLDGYHEVLVVLKVTKCLVKVCHGYSKVKFW